MKTNPLETLERQEIIDKLKEKETKFKEKISLHGKFTDKKDVQELKSYYS